MRDRAVTPARLPPTPSPAFKSSKRIATADPRQHVPAVSSLGACPTPALTPRQVWQALLAATGIAQPLTI
jgi:hypothetical protein